MHYTTQQNPLFSGSEEKFPLVTYYFYLFATLIDDNFLVLNISLRLSLKSRILENLR